MVCKVHSCGEVDVNELRDTNFVCPCCGRSPLDWGRCFWTSEANFVTSLDVGVLFLGLGSVFLVLRTCLLMLSVLSLEEGGCF